MGKPSGAAQAAAQTASGGGSSATGLSSLETSTVIAEESNILTESDLDARSGTLILLSKIVI